MSTKLLIGFVAGAAVGALAGILMAPEAGAETRKKISDKASELGDTAKEALNGIVDKAKNVYGGAKDQAQDYADTARNKMSSAKNDVTNALS